MEFREGSVIADIEMIVPSDMDFDMIYAGIVTGVESSDVIKSLGITEAYINGNFTISLYIRLVIIYKHRVPGLCRYVLKQWLFISSNKLFLVISYDPH